MSESFGNFQYSFRTIGENAIEYEFTRGTKLVAHGKAADYDSARALYWQFAGAMPMNTAPHVSFPATIKLVHFERGLMSVFWSEDYMYYVGERVWVDDNSDGVCYPEEEFLGWLK